METVTLHQPNRRGEDKNNFILGTLFIFYPRLFTFKNFFTGIISHLFQRIDTHHKILFLCYALVANVQDSVTTCLEILKPNEKKRQTILENVKCVLHSIQSMSNSCQNCIQMQPVQHIQGLKL